MFYSKLYSQISIGTIERQKESIVLKPEPYDSLKNFTKQERLIDYKQFIGLEFFLPPFNNPIIGQYENESSKPYFFSLTPTILSINKDVEELRLIESIEYKRYEYMSVEYDKILTNIYKPFHYYSSRNPYIHISNSNEIGNSYFTLIQVLYEEELNAFWKSIDSIINYHKESLDVKKILRNPETRITFENAEKIFVDKESIITYSSKPEIIIIFKVNNTNDTVFCLNSNPNLFLVPYFIKQKKIYEGKYLICQGNILTKDIKTSKQIKVTDLSRWYCSEVSLFKNGDINPISNDSYNVNDRFSIYYILKNEADETIALNYIDKNSPESAYYYFLEENEYSRLETVKKLKQEELIAKKKMEEEKLKEEKLKKYEIRRTEYINKYGQIYGELIAQGKVKTGMNTEMCRSSWGMPFNIKKNTFETTVYEVWYYGLGYSLHFENGILTRIIE